MCTTGQLCTAPYSLICPEDLEAPQLLLLAERDMSNPTDSTEKARLSRRSVALPAILFSWQSHQQGALQQHKGVLWVSVMLHTHDMRRDAGSASGPGWLPRR